MALHEIPEEAEAVITANETLRIRKEFLQMGRNMQRSLREIRNSVAKAGKSNIIAELGDDAADMNIVFNKVRTLTDILLNVSEPDVDGN